jgi:hypothetical protein
MPSRSKAQRLQDRAAENSEYQVAHHFFAAPHRHGVAAMVVLQLVIEPFGRAGFTETNLFRETVPNMALPFCFICECLLEPGRGAQIDADDRRMTEIAAVLLIASAS